MTLPESFDPHLNAQGYVHRDEDEFLDGPAQEEHLSPADVLPLHNWQEQLLPLSCVAAEDNLTVLRMELETAHQLLQYQQTVLDSLTERLTNSDLQLQHTQDELTATRQTCDRQSAEFSEIEAVCRDLKMQLRRQQQRVLQYRNLLNEQTMHPLHVPAAVTTASMVTIGYESISVETQPRPSAAKSPPVSAWSAPEPIDLTGPLACYRKLATIRMTTSTIRVETVARSSSTERVSNGSQTPVLSQAGAGHQSGVLNKRQAVQVDLPRFTKQ
ncbi:MAG: hypothetical protein WCD18_15865 [Thermosynechococcaceae cyanobacterium]